MKREKLGNFIKQTTRKLRREQTESEAVLWEVLRNRKLMHKKFLRQYPVVFDWEGRKRFFIADFYCHEARLAVELDGAVHLMRKDYDEVRDYILKSLGIKVVRIKNDEVTNNLHGAIDLLKKELETHPQAPSLKKRGGVKQKSK